MKKIAPARFNSELRSLNKISECTKFFKNSISRFGFNTLACGELDLLETARHAFFVIDWPKSWERFYLKHDLLNRDPLLPAVEFYRRPFSWTELKKDIRISADGQAVLREAGERGWHNGLVVPISRG